MYQDDGSIKTLGIIKEGFYMEKLMSKTAGACRRLSSVIKLRIIKQPVMKRFSNHIKKELVTLDKVKYREYYSILDGVYKTFYPE